MVVCSAYLWVKEGLSERYVQLLSDVGRVLSMHRRPFVWGSDFNMSPDQIASSAITAVLNAEICCHYAPKGTCVTNGVYSTIDFFIASSDIANAAVDTQVVDAPIPTHRVVCLTLPHDAAGMKKLTLSAHTNLLVERLPGPSLPFNWDLPPARWR